jgi:hypothetical protein
MKSMLVLLAVVCLVATAAAQVPWGEEPWRPRWQVYALEGLGALGGVVGCGCLAAGGAAVYVSATWSFDGPDDDPGAAGWVGAGVALVSAVALPAAAGYGAAKAGENLGEYGSTGWAVGGAYAGALVGAGLVSLGNSVSRSDAARITSYVLGGLAVSTGAAVGYNLGIKHEVSPFGLGGRLQTPAVALTGVELPDHSVEYGVKVQLAGLRF